MQRDVIDRPQRRDLGYCAPPPAGDYIAIRWESVLKRYLRGPTHLAFFKYRKVAKPPRAQIHFPRFALGTFLYEYDSTFADRGDEMH